MQWRPLASASRLRPHLLIVLFSLLLSLPFIFKPFHIDDHLYLKIAENAIKNPLFAHDFPLIYEGKSYPDMASHSHPPGMGYLLAPAILLSRRLGLPLEPVTRLLMIVFLALAGSSALALARRLIAGGEPLADTNPRGYWSAELFIALLLVASPAVLIVSQTLSPDLPALALWLAALVFYSAGIESGDRRRLLFGAILQTGALAISYQAAAIAPLVLFYGWLRRSLNRAVWSFALAPLAMLALWLVVCYLHYGRFTPLLTIEFAAGRQSWSAARSAEKVVALLSYIGGTVTFPLFLAAPFAGWLRGRALALAALSAAIICQLVAGHYALWQKALLVFFVALGLLFSGRAFVEVAAQLARLRSRAGCDRTALFLGLWFCGVLLYCSTILFTSTARYILPLVLPALLLLGRNLDSSYRRGYLAACLAATVSLSLLLAAADYEFAHIYVDISNKLRRDFASRGFAVNFCGEWGFRHYLEAAGFKLLGSDDSTLRGGEIVARPRLATPYRLAEDLESIMVKIDSLSYTPRLPLRLLDDGSRAGFYASHWGLLPYSFSRSPLERVDLYQVSLLAEQLPEARLEEGATLPFPILVEQAGARRLFLGAPPPWRLAYKIQVPQNGRLRFSYGAAAHGDRPLPAEPSWPPAGYELRIYARERGSHLLFCGLAGPHEGLKNAEVDLSRFSGKKIELAFEAHRAGADQAPGHGEGTIGWADLVIVPEDTISRLDYSSLRFAKYNQPSAYHGDFWELLDLNMAERDFSQLRSDGFNGIAIPLPFGSFVTEVSAGPDPNRPGASIKIDRRNLEKFEGLLQLAERWGLVTVLWLNFHRLPRGVPGTKVEGYRDPSGRYHVPFVGYFADGAAVKFRGDHRWHAFLEFCRLVARAARGSRIIWDPLDWQNFAVYPFMSGDHDLIAAWREHLEQQNPDLAYWSARWKEKLTSWQDVLPPVSRESLEAIRADMRRADYSIRIDLKAAEAYRVYRNRQPTPEGSAKWLDFARWQDQLLNEINREIVRAIKGQSTAPIGQRLDVERRYGARRESTWSAAPGIDLIMYPMALPALDISLFQQELAEAQRRARCPAMLWETSLRAQRGRAQLWSRAVALADRLGLGLGLWCWRDNYFNFQTDQGNGLRAVDGSLKADGVIQHLLADMELSEVVPAEERRDTPNGRAAFLGRIGCADGEEDALITVAPARVGLPILSTADNLIIRARVTMPTDIGDGAEARIVLEESSGKRLLFRRQLEPSRGGCRWSEIAIPIASANGPAGSKTRRLWFEAEGGRSGDLTGDWIAWGAPVIEKRTN